MVVPQEIVTGTRQLLAMKQTDDAKQKDPLLKAEKVPMEKPLIRETMQESTAKTKDTWRTLSDRNDMRETIEVEVTSMDSLVGF